MVQRADALKTENRITERPGYLLVLLTVSYMLAFIDRQVLGLLVGPIRQDLGISDVQISLLQGMAFDDLERLQPCPRWVRLGPRSIYGAGPLHFQQQSWLVRLQGAISGRHTVRSDPA